jgi:hypothetical protein
VKIFAPRRRAPGAVIKLPSDWHRPHYLFPSLYKTIRSHARRRSGGKHGTLFARWQQGRTVIRTAEVVAFNEVNANEVRALSSLTRRSIYGIPTGMVVGRAAGNSGHHLSSHARFLTVVKSRLRRTPLRSNNTVDRSGAFVFSRAYFLTYVRACEMAARADPQDLAASSASALRSDGK